MATSTQQSATSSPDAQRLTYPISPEYVKGWTAERAIAELVANAIDEDPADFTFKWKNGILRIEDNAPGIGDHGLILGISRKSKQQIGQFGEGINIACLVLARDRKIGKIHVETAGYSFEPLIVRQQLIAVGNNDGKELPEMLAIDIVANERERGTLIQIECPEKLAEKVKQRFLHFEPGYTPTEDGRVIGDGEPGRVYIGGVLIAEKRKLLFSYDFSLAAAKEYQNRDRTIMDSQVQDRLIHETLGQLADEALIKRWVEAALANTLSRSEQCFYGHAAPEQKVAFAKVGEALYGKRKVCFSNEGYDDQEASLDCRDRGYEILENKIGYEFSSLMSLLGVPSASSLYKKPRATTTEWIKEKSLSDKERETLTTAIKIVRSVYGEDAVGRCDAYEWTRSEQSDEDLEFGGFYVPQGGRIGIQRENLDSLSSTLRVLGHESAHRRRHRHSNYEYHDRTRGFESELDGMLRDALLILHEEGVLDKVRERGNAKAKQEKSEEATYNSTHPAPLMRALIVERKKALGLTNAQLAKQSGVSTHCVAALLNGYRRNGYKGTGAPELKRTNAVMKVLGLRGELVHLCLLSEGIVGTNHVHPSGYDYYDGLSRRGKVTFAADGKRQEGKGRIRGTRGDEVEKCIDKLAGEADVAPFTPPVRVQLNAAFDSSDETWMEPYKHMVSAEKIRVQSATAA